MRALLAAKRAASRPRTWSRMALQCPMDRCSDRSSRCHRVRCVGFASWSTSYGKGPVNGHDDPSKGAFVSKYYQLANSQEIGEFLRRKKMVFKETDTHLVVRECPFCHPTRGKSDNLFKLYIHKTQGMYMCHRCGSSGSWFDFKQKMPGNGSSVAINSASGVMSGAASSDAMQRHHHQLVTEDEVKVIQALDNEKAIAIQKNLTEEPDFAPVLEYLTKTRGLELDTLKKYCVGAIEQPFRDDDGNHVVSKCVSFPWMARRCDLDAMGVLLDDKEEDDENESQCAANSIATNDKNLFDVIRLKIRAYDHKSMQRLVPKGGSWGLFGWHTVPSSANEIVLTEGEFDAMAVYQATGLPAISLPNGCRSLPPSVLPLLERFTRIYLWMDNDAAGQANVNKFATKLGLPRCYIVRIPTDLTLKKMPKDANDALLMGMDLKKIINQAQRTPHSQITTFEQLRREVFEEIIHPVRIRGVQSRTLPSLNKFLKGHRMGEVTVLTGPTGCGKTTFLSQLSLDLCGQGVNTLWGSFEIKNTRLIHKMLTQLAGKSLENDVKAFEQVADRFEVLPMYFLRFFGSTDVDEVLDAMEYAVYAYDVQHILLDNVQFMMAGQGRGFDKFERQDAALDKFRRFASEKNIHLTLVIHPRKEQEDIDLNLSSVFGTAKATQEADNVLILQRTSGQTKLDIRKNRFDGTLGSIPLMFDKGSNSMREVNEETMDDEVSAVDWEAQMAFSQKARAKQAQLASQAPPIEYELEQVDPREIYGDAMVHDAALVPEPQYEIRMDSGINAVANASSSRGLGRSNMVGSMVNGATRLPPTRAKSSLASSSSFSNSQTNGRRINSNSDRDETEPFSCFTPIITK